MVNQIATDRIKELEDKAFYSRLDITDIRLLLDCLQLSTTLIFSNNEYEKENTVEKLHELLS